MNANTKIMVEKRSEIARGYIRESLDALKEQIATIEERIARDGHADPRMFSHLSEYSVTASIEAEKLWAYLSVAEQITR